MAIHGWVPVRKRGPSCEFGLFYPAGNVGFIVCYMGHKGAMPVVSLVNLVNFPNDSVYEECPWDALFNDTIDIIEARLQQV